MASDHQNAQLYAGDAAELAIEITDEEGEALDLSGASLSWTLARSPFAESNVISKASGNGILVDGSTATVSLSGAETADLLGDYWHQLVVTDAQGNPSTVATGVLTVRKRI